MKKQKTSTKKATKLDMDLQTPVNAVEKAPESSRQTDLTEPLTMFDVQRRRMAREAK